MRFRYKIVVFMLLAIGVLFARESKNNVRIEGKKVNNEHHWAKGNSEENDNNLYRKRVHKRRRKIKKPVKGLR